MPRQEPEIPHCRPELFRARILQASVRIEPYVGTPASVKHHRKHWLSRGYLSDLRDLFPRVIPEARNVLEVGCGMGHLHEILRIPRSEYTGLDLNAGFLAEGRRHYPGIRLVQGVSNRLPFRTGQFDHVLCSDLLIHLPDMVPTLREIVRVCRGDVLLRIRTGDGSAQGSKMVFDPEKGRLYSRVHLDGQWRYFYYNCLLEEDFRAMLSFAGIEDARFFDVSDGKDGRMALTKVFFKTATGVPLRP